MIPMSKEFTECEHEGDAENVYADIRKAGGYNIRYELNDSAETAEFTWEVNSVHDFETKFKETDSYGF